MVNLHLSRKYVLMIVIAIVVILIGGVLLLHHGSKQNSATSTTVTGKAETTQKTKSISNSPGAAVSVNPTSSTENKDLSAVISGDDNPTGMQYIVTSGTKPVNGWYVVQVEAANEYGTFDQIAILKQGSNSNDSELADVIAGPDTSFPIGYLRSVGVPESIISQVPTYDDAQ